MIDFLLLILIAVAMIVGYRVLIAKRPGSTSYKWAMGIALVSAFLLFWVNGAVGLIGDENHDANMMYAGLLAVGGIGAMLSRFRPRGMARTMGATALVQVCVAIVALLAGWGNTGPIWPRDILIVTVFFTALWSGSAWLFRKAALEKAPTAKGAKP